MRRYIDSQSELTDEKRKYISYEFEEVVTDILTEKLIRAQEQTWAKMIMLAGGVSANTRLKEKILTKANERDLTFLAPVKNIYSMDNAAMVGIRAYYEVSHE